MKFLYHIPCLFFCCVFNLPCATIVNCLYIYTMHVLCRQEGLNSLELFSRLDYYYYSSKVLRMFCTVTDRRWPMLFVYSVAVDYYFFLFFLLWSTILCIYINNKHTYTNKSTRTKHTHSRDTMKKINPEIKITDKQSPRSAHQPLSIHSINKNNERYI